LHRWQVVPRFARNLASRFGQRCERGLYRFQPGWWPLHPVGLVLSASDNHKSMVLPVFIAWAAKSICLRVGGVQLYDRMKPLVVGLLVGYTFGVILSFGVDAFLFPGEGHELHSW